MKFKKVIFVYVYWENKDGNSCRSYDGKTYSELMGCSWEKMWDINDEVIEKEILKILKEGKDGNKKNE